MSRSAGASRGPSWHTWMTPPSSDTVELSVDSVPPFTYGPSSETVMGPLSLPVRPGGLDECSPGPAHLAWGDADVRARCCYVGRREPATAGPGDRCQHGRIPCP